jgi:hypothetical protein
MCTLVIIFDESKVCHIELAAITDKPKRQLQWILIVYMGRQGRSCKYQLGHNNTTKYSQHFPLIMIIIQDYLEIVIEGQYVAISHDQINDSREMCQVGHNTTARYLQSFSLNTIVI